jgi:hypothetical protein
LPSYVALSEASAIVYVIEDTSPYYQTGTLSEAIAYMYGIEEFFASIADIFILLCLVELALSVLRAFANYSPNYKVIRISNFVVMAVLFVLAIAAVAKAEIYANEVLVGSIASWTTVGKLYGAYGIIYWIISLGLVFVSTFVLCSSMQKKQQQSVSKSILDPPASLIRSASPSSIPFSAPSSLIH